MIRRTNLPVNRHTQICSKHFVNAEGRRLYPDEVPSLCLPRPFICSRETRRKPPRDRSAVLNTPTDDEMQRDEDVSEDEESRDASTQTEMNLAE